jgi:hypothetical protein
MNFVEQEVSVNELFDRIAGNFDFSKPGIFDVSSSGIEIESFDFETGEKVYSLIQNLIVKEPVYFYYQIGSLKATAGHLVYSDEASKFIRADEHPEAKRLDEKMFVVDFTIDKTHNYYANGFLNHNTSPGGKALKHACSVMINMAPMNGADNRVEDENEEIVGHKVKAKIQKNKVGAPYREAIYTVKYTKGIINKNEEVLNLAILMGLVDRPNNKTYAYGNEKFNGKQAILDYLQDPVKMELLEEACRERYLSGDGPVSSMSSSHEGLDSEETPFDDLE